MVVESSHFSTKGKLQQITTSYEAENTLIKETVVFRTNTVQLFCLISLKQGLSVVPKCGTNIMGEKEKETEGPILPLTHSQLGFLKHECSITLTITK